MGFCCNLVPLKRTLERGGARCECGRIGLAGDRQVSSGSAKESPRTQRSFRRNCPPLPARRIHQRASAHRICRRPLHSSANILSPSLKNALHCKRCTCLIFPVVFECYSSLAINFITLYKASCSFATFVLLFLKGETKIGGALVANALKNVSVCTGS